ncbi:1-deoxy-D-xylulose-5-phosphate synthase [Theileria orientalis]|uniref:1-deoxy-D-xylulose-5-phosphate synthase n=1 Tax=Theileria orientalis TaxID=68886 RepID=A0A976QS41_THEOR|nr:1-deoxy-D-xylulose-5-phosphate synthase [Theileria orientalis]
MEFNGRLNDSDYNGCHNEDLKYYEFLFKVNSPQELKKLPVDCLFRLCNEIRTYLGEKISKSGGHFSGSLGVTELTVALHYVFESPVDKIVWDIGHQAYVHKILTGRRDRLETMRKKGGLSGFCRMYESDHDIFGAGHSSTSISFSQGLWEAQKLLNGHGIDNGVELDSKVISIIGDGGMTGGLAYEALNYSINLKTPLVIIYNDNDQVSLPTGLSSAMGYKPVLPFFLEKTSDQGIKPLNEALEEFYASLSNNNGNNGNGAGGSGSLAGDLNIIGPIDGHNIYELIGLFNMIKNPQQCGGNNTQNTTNTTNTTYTTDNIESISNGVNSIQGHKERYLYVGNVRVNGPLIIHIKTIKGMGCPQAIKSLDTMHSIGPNTPLTMVDLVLNNSPNITDSRNCEYGQYSSMNTGSDTANGGMSTTNDTANGPIDTTHSLEYYKKYISNVGNKASIKDEVFDSDSYSHVFSRTLVKLAEVDPKIVAVTAAMPGGTGVGLFGTFFPSRTFDVGICEQHAITFSAGLASAGLKPFVSLYSTFLQRGLDQLIHDVLIQDINIKLMIDRAGYVGEDGLSHHGNYDVNMLRMFKNLAFMFPSDQLDLTLMLKLASDLNRPVAIRYPKDKVPNKSQLGYDSDFYEYVKHFNFLKHMNNTSSGYGDPITGRITDVTSDSTIDRTTDSRYANNGNSISNEFNEYYNDLRNFKSKVVRQGRDVAILSLGPVLHNVIRSMEYLDSTFDPTVIDMRFLNPLDISVLEKLKQSHERLVIVEEVISGGLGTAVLEHLTETNKLSQFKIKCINYPYEFIHHATRQEQMEMAEIDPKGIADQIRSFLKQS